MSEQNIQESINFVKDLLNIEEENDRNGFFYYSMLGKNTETQEPHKYDLNTLPDIPFYKDGKLVIKIPVYMLVLNFIDSSMESGGWHELKIYNKKDSEGWSYQRYKAYNPYKEGDKDPNPTKKGFSFKFKSKIRKSDQELATEKPLILSRKEAFEYITSFYEDLGLNNHPLVHGFSIKNYLLPEHEYNVGQMFQNDGSSSSMSLDKDDIKVIQEFIKLHVGISNIHQKEVAQELHKLLKKDIYQFIRSIEHPNTIKETKKKKKFYGIDALNYQERLSYLEKSALFFMSNTSSNKEFNNLSSLLFLKDFLNKSPYTEDVLIQLKEHDHNDVFKLKRIHRIHKFIDRYYKQNPNEDDSEHHRLKRIKNVVNEISNKQKILAVSINRDQIKPKKKNRILKTY
jgi:hypothetical protein